jgi:Uma2 family endonuclease
MEATTLKFPETLDEFDENELVRLPATWDEYLELAEDAPYTVQFLNNEVIMSQASRLHESLIIILGVLLYNYFSQKEGYDVLGSNVKIVIPNQEGDFNADLSVVREPVDYGLTPTGRVSTMRIKNPEIVVEVLSKSTRKFDQGEKLAYYKLIPSLQHILFVDQDKPFASVYSRTGNPDEWLNHDYRTLESVIRLGHLTLPMQDIYRKTVFES